MRAGINGVDRIRKSQPVESERATELKDDHGTFLTQPIGLYQWPRDTDAKGGEVSPAHLQGGEQLKARADQEDHVGSGV